MPERNFVNAHDVAREAGVSQSAVSRAFTPGASIAQQTRDKIMAAAERMGYHPNLLARSLINGRSNIVGVGVDDLNNPFFVQSLQLLSRVLDEVGLRLMLFPMGQRGETEPSVNEILHYRLDALVLLSTSLSSGLAEECRRAHVPVILYNRTTKVHNVSTVTGDNETGARTVAWHLLAGEHRRIAFIAGSEESSTNARRQSAFFDYLAKEGVGEPMREVGHFNFEAAMTATRKLLMRKLRPDAIFCANDTMAIAAINVARFEFGISIGQELSIVGYDDVPMAKWPAFSLTSYAQNAHAMVAQTVKMITDLREYPDRHSVLVVEGELKIRGSSRIAARNNR